MVREEWQVLGTEARKLHVREWIPSNTQSKGLVVIVHGQGEHSGRYEGVAEQMTAAGLTVVSYDLQGHGRSEGKRGHLNAMSAAVDDVLRVIEEACDRHPNTPVFLYGHSMGGNIAFNTALSKKPEIYGLILSSPWLRLAFKPPKIKEWAGRALAKIAPAMPVSSGLKPEDLFRPSELDIPPIQNDPLCHTTITPRAFLEVEKAGEWALRNASELHVPLLLLHGDADRVTSYEASKQLAESLGNKCDWFSKPGGLHELHNDKDGKVTVGYIVDWILSKL